MKGIDVSNHNGRIDWNKLKNSDVKVVYIKASEGTTYQDPYLNQHYQGAKSIGLPTGFYHYLKGTSAPESQAQNFWSLIKDKENNLIPCLDIEENGFTVMDYALRFISKFKELSNLPILIYTGPYFANDNLDKAELEGIAFSELYTRAQSLIRSISTCGVRGKILRSNELIELLYMAYNREDAETFGLDKAIKAGFNEMYSTAPDVLKKKMKEIDKTIEEKAIQIAKEKVNEAKSEIEQEIEDKENHIDELIGQMAKMIIAENEEYIGNDVVNRAIEKVTEELTQKSNTKEGGNENGKKKTTRGRKRSTTN